MSKPKKSQNGSERDTERRSDDPQKDSEHQSTNLDQANRFTKHLSRNKLSYELLFSLITAAATAILAFITYQSLSAVTDQQTLSYRQFVLANQPSVRAYLYPNGPVEFKDDKVIFNWVVTNKGGYVQDLTYQTAIMAFNIGSEDQEPQFKIRKEKFAKRTFVKDRLERDEIAQNYWATGGEFGENWVKDALEDKMLFTCISFRVQYSIPPELTVDGVGRQEHRFIFYRWNPTLKRLYNAEGEELIAVYSALIEA